MGTRLRKILTILYTANSIVLILLGAVIGLEKPIISICAIIAGIFCGLIAFLIYRKKDK